MAEETTKEVKTETPAEEASPAVAPEAAAKDEPSAAAAAEVPAKFKDLVKSLESLTVLELSELVKVLEGHFGVSAAAPMAMASAAPAGGEAEAAEEKSAYTVMLSGAGEQKINVIKAVREITGLGLAESKALVDAAPKAVKENVPKAEADEAKKALEAAGASVELQ